MTNLENNFNAVKSDINNVLSTATQAEIDTGDFLYQLDMENYNDLRGVFAPELRRNSNELLSSVAQRMAVSSFDEMLAKASKF